MIYFSFALFQPSLLDNTLKFTKKNTFISEGKSVKNIQIFNI